MNVRTTKPTSGNKFFITKSKGGYSTCIQGSPTDSQCNVLSNCVGYACGRFNEIIGAMKYPSLNCNAENFIERAKNTYGLEISSVPTLGGIMVWQKGTLSGNDGAGHVAVVEKIIDSNTIYTSESGYGGSAFWNSTRRNTNGRWGLGSAYTFRGCIVNPAIGKVVAPTPTPSAKKSVDEVAKEVIRGEWGNGDERYNRLTNAGYNYNEVQRAVEAYKKTPAPAPVKKSNEEIATEVLAGKWGNGQDRKNRLTAAGYDYATIQNIVNGKKPSPAPTPAKKSNAEIAKEVWAGKWGNGTDRRKRLEAAGYNYAAVQAEVEKIIKGGKATSNGYRVQITAGALNVRAGAGTGYRIVKVVHKGEIYTIV